MYCLGMLKSQIITLPMIMQQIDTVDKIVYQRYMANMLTPDEMLPMYSPQIICISREDLNGEEFPALEAL